MRCLALAQACQEVDAGVAFALAMDPPSGFASRLQDAGMVMHRIAAAPGSEEDARELTALAIRVDASWVVVDGYRFGAAYRRRLREAGRRVLCVDDCGDIGPYGDDAVLNQNPYACEAMYEPRGARTRLLLGTRYALLRDEFRAWRDHRRDVPQVVRKILITLGGGDADNVTETVLAALQSLGARDLEAVVLVGGANPHYETLCCTARSVPFPVRVEENRSEVSHLMAWADLAVAAGGTTCWELALMGLPACVVVVADNQARGVDSLVDMGVVASMGRAAELSAERIARTLDGLIHDHARRQRMQTQGRTLVDGRGAERVARILREVA